MTIEHIDAPPGEIHVAHNWEYANAAAREGATITDATLVKRLALQLDDNTLWILTDTTPVTWAPVGGSGGGSDIVVKNEGTNLTTAVTSIDFVGAGVTASNTGGAVTVTIEGGGGGGSAIIVQDEGSTLTTGVTKINFVGAQVTATEPTPDEITVTIPTPSKSDVGLGSVENTALSSWAGSGNITTLGTVGTGVWQGTALAANYGGTGQTAYAVGDTLYASGAAVLSKLSGNTTTTKKFLSQTGDGSASAAPAWDTLAAGDIPNLPWSKITSGLPTTRDGYGITDVYTMAQTDALFTGLDQKQSVRVATTANIALSGTQTIDGVSVVAGDRVLVKDQNSTSLNGIYVVASGAWSRATDADSNAEVTGGMYCWVTEGTTNADSGWRLTTNDPIVLGTTGLIFAQFNGVGSYTAGTGLTLTGSQFSITSVITAGTYGSATQIPVLVVNAQGQITGVTLTTITPAWGSITGKPTTISGYGITDALTTAGGTLTGKLILKRGADLASASTVDATTATGDIVDITGTTTINQIALAEGQRLKVRFTGVMTLVHTNNAFHLLGAADIVTAAGDMAEFVGYNSGFVRMHAYHRAASLPAAERLPLTDKSANYTCVLADANKSLLHPSADTTARTFTIPANASVAYPIGTSLTFVNQNGAGTITIAITTDTMRLAGAGSTGNRTLTANGIATALKLTATEWLITGTNLT